MIFVKILFNIFLLHKPKSNNMKKNSIVFWTFISIVMFFSGNSHAQNLWAAKIGGTQNDRCNAVTSDASGNVYLTGWFQGTVDFNPGTATNNLTSYGNYDIFVLKLDASGNYVWAKQLGGTVNDIGNAIAVDASGNVYLTGNFEGTADFDPGATAYSLTAPGGNSDAFICKLNSSGNFVWAKKIGDTNLEEGLGIALDASGNVYTTGYFSSPNTDFNPGTGTFTISPVGFNDAYVSKLDANGNFVWAKAFSGANYEVGNAISVDASGNVYTTGSFRSSVDFDPGTTTSYLTSLGWKDIFICKLTSAGAFAWAKRIGDVNDDEGIAITTDASANVYVTGYFMGTADFDPDAGTTNLTSAGNYDIFITKFNTSGNLVWAKSIGTTTEDCGRAIDADASGNVYTTGYFYGAADFDPGAGINVLTPSGNSDAFISKLDVSGNFVWAKRMGGTNFDFGNALTIDINGSVITAGYFQGTGDFDPGSGVYNLTSAGSYDIFINKSQNISDVSVAEEKINSLTIYPNPASDFVRIKGNKICSVTIMNSTGQVFRSLNTDSSEEVSLPVNDFRNGLYFIRVQEGKEFRVFPFIKN